MSKKSEIRGRRSDIRSKEKGVPDAVYMSNKGIAVMDMKRGKTTTEEFENAAAAPDRAKYVFRLYVTGMTPKSILAIANTRKICEKYLEGRYELKVIDIYQQPELAKGEQIIATPTLIKKYPLPLRRLVGNMSDTERFLAGIGLKIRNS